MYIVRAEEKQIEKIVNMSVRAFETDVNVGGIKGDCPPLVLHSHTTVGHCATVLCLPPGAPPMAGITAI